MIGEHYREPRRSWKLDLALPTAARSNCSPSRSPAAAQPPEACGLRHLAFAVDDVDQWSRYLESRGVAVRQIRVDEYTGRRFTFFADPDGLPLELYES